MLGVEAQLCGERRNVGFRFSECGYQTLDAESREGRGGRRKSVVEDKETEPTGKLSSHLSRTNH